MTRSLLPAMNKDDMRGEKVEYLEEKHKLEAKKRSCSWNYWLNEESNMCYRCHFSCYSCVGDLPNECTRCNGNH